ncbi:inositol-tetrakisphosphate 1-kinase 1-like protein [Tanacetum coccineum]
MLEVVAELEAACMMEFDPNSDTFGTPKQVAIYEPEQLKEGTGLNEGLENVKCPIVLQEFVNHGGVIFKVYVVGEYVKCVKRKSLADISDEKLSTLHGSFRFCQVSNVKCNNVTNDESYYKCLEDAEMPPTSLINKIARGLRKAMKLHLFNFDVIRDTRVGNRRGESSFRLFLQKEVRKWLITIGAYVEENGGLHVRSVVKDEQDGVQV